MKTSYPDSLVETLDRETLTQIQLTKLQTMLSQVLKTNTFFQRKLKEVGVEEPEDIRTLEDYRQLPFTTKEELSADQEAHPPYGTNITFPRKDSISASIKHRAQPVNRCVGWIPRRVGIGGLAVGGQCIMQPA